MGTPDWAALRGEFPTLAHWTYLDVARKTVAPRCQESAMQAYTRDVYENAGADAWSAVNVAEARAVMARLLGARPSEIAFTKNTTEGLNIAAHGFDLRPGDNVLLTDLEHVANVWVWKHWEKKGVEIRYVRSREGRLPLEAFLECMDGSTRVVSTAYVTYGNGYRVNLPALGRACRERGARLVVDGVQAAGVLAAPLSELNADIVAIGGHKGLFGLTGSGVVYCREELVNQLRADFVKQPAAEPAGQAHVVSQFDYVRTAHRFEGGNPNFLGVRVLAAGAEFIQSIGLSHIESRVRALTTTCLKLLKAAGLDSQTPDAWDERAHIINVLVPDAAGLMQRLRERHRVVANVKDGALRLSMSFFNSEEDLERAVHAIGRELSREARTGHACDVKIALNSVALLVLFAGTAFAQYPDKPIRLIVPFGPGGGSDYVGRLVGLKLTEQMGQTVVVDNRPGAASLVGTEIAARAAADGYTLLLADSGFTINFAYYRSVKYDAFKDFDPVTVVAETPYLLVVNPGLPYATGLKEYIAAAKAQPGKVNIGSAGNGSGTHLSGELFKLRAGLNLTHVPYKSAGASVADVVGGQIQSSMTSAPPALPLAKAGRLRVLASAAAKRTALLPDVPTFAEGGVNGVEVTNWYSVMSVGGTPKLVLKRLHDELMRAIASPDMRERLAAGALEPAPNTPEQFRKMIAAELQRWARVIKDAGIKQE